MRVQVPCSIAGLTLFLSVPALVTMPGLCAADAYGAGGDSVQLQAGSSQLEVQRNGQWRLTRQGQELVRNARLVIAAPGWKASSGQQKLQAAAGAPPQQEDRFSITGQIHGPGADVRWDFSEEIRPIDGGWRLAYQLRPRSQVDAGEIALFIDLPLKTWAGKQLLLWPLSAATLPESPPSDQHFLNGPLRTLVLRSDEHSQSTLRMNRMTTCTVQDTRTWKGDVYQAYIQLHHQGRIEAGQKLGLEFELRPDDRQEFVIPTVSLAARRPLAIRSVRPSSASVPRFGLLRVRAEISGSYDTPFDPEQIAVDAHITSPSGKSLLVPAFFNQDYQPSDDAEGAYLVPQGDSFWELRFTPVEVGQYRFVLAARDRSGETRWAEESFRCEAAQRCGFVRVSQRDHRYFEFDNGWPYFAVGENMATCRGPVGTTDFHRWLTRLGAAGGNYARIWMCSPCFGIEWGKPGVYRLDHAWHLDRALDMAEQNGIYVKLCLESWRGFAGKGSFVRGEDVHPYWKRNGGPCEKEIEVFTNPEARRMFRNRLRYLVARWGYSTHLFGWEFWNEINCVRGYDAEIVAHWTQEMARYLHEIDPWRHLVVNSLGSFLVDERYWRLPEIDFAQVHGYWNPKSAESRELGRDMARFVPYWIEKIRGYGKPALFAEFGLVNDHWGPSLLADKDPQGVHLHNGLWSAMMAGAAGTAMLWWWDSYVDPHDLYWQFSPVVAFARDVPWTSAGFEPIVGRSPEPRLRVLGLRGPKQVLVWLQNEDHTWWNEVQGKHVAAIARATAAIEGVSPGDWEAQWWDTWRGKALRRQRLRASGGGLELTVTGLDRDVAVKLKHMGP